MIPITDLRLRNYVHKISEDRIVKVTSMNLSRDMGDYSGIPITTALLIEKCGGWVKNSVFITYKISNRCHIRYYNGYGICIAVEMSDSYDYTEYDLLHIQYLHQLQNLIYSLTGQEMAIKL